MTKIHKKKEENLKTKSFFSLIIIVIIIRYLTVYVTCPWMYMYGTIQIYIVGVMVGGPF